MRSFLHHLVEKKEVEKELPNSRGVLIHGSKLFVGVNYGKPLELTPQAHALVKYHIKKYGHWDEADGSGKKDYRHITGKHKSRGSFDSDLVGAAFKKNPDALKDPETRNSYLLDKAPPGVYFIGSGHLPSMSETVRSRGIKPRLIGGSHAHL